MSDLCAPIYVVMDADEEMTFWCFMQFMEKMVGDFQGGFELNLMYVEWGLEKEFFAGSERDEETAFDVAAAD